MTFGIYGCENSPQHPRLLGLNDVEEHEDGVEKVVPALKHKPDLSESVLNRTQTSVKEPLQGSGHLRQAVDVSLVHELVVRRGAAALVDAEKVLLGNI